jgi:hypothetical protein
MNRAPDRDPPAERRAIAGFDASRGRRKSDKYQPE